MLIPVHRASDPPASFEVGVARPNPARDRFSIPIAATAAGTRVTVEIWDVQGRLVWRDGPTPVADLDGSLHWDGRDSNGALVPAGSYFCRVSNGAERREQTIAVVR